MWFQLELDYWQCSAVAQAALAMFHAATWYSRAVKVSIGLALPFYDKLVSGLQTTRGVKTRRTTEHVSDSTHQSSNVQLGKYTHIAPQALRQGTSGKL